MQYVIVFAAILVLLGANAHAADVRLIGQEPRDVKLTPYIPKQYPLYKQCDSRWGSDLIVHETVCAVGCLMSSISSGLAGKGIHIDGNVSDPGTLNAWLKTHGGYDDHDDLNEFVVSGLNYTAIQYIGSLRNQTDLGPAAIRSLINLETIVIANVMHGRHFVLLTGWDTLHPDQIFYVNDSGFDRAYYTYSDFVGYRLYQVRQQ